VTILADLLRPADRQRLLERGTLASPAEPEPLHRAGRKEENLWASGR
jgi:hypothetical protein